MPNIKDVICYPGQGSGFTPGFTDGAARHVFEEASERLGYDVYATCVDQERTLMDPALSQPAMVVNAMATTAAVEEAGLTTNAAVGHSLGEYGSLFYGRVLGVADLAELSADRGSFTAAAMEDNPTGKMVALMGKNIDVSRVAKLCEGLRDVWPGNYNAPGQIVVTGLAKSIESLMLLIAKELGDFKERDIVDGPFHSPLLAQAAERLRLAIGDRVDFHFPERRIFSSTTAGEILTDKDAEDVVIRQLYSPVRFIDTILELRRLGARRFYELAPPSDPLAPPNPAQGVAIGLIRRILRNEEGIQLYRIGTPEELDIVLCENAKV